MDRNNRPRSREKRIGLGSSRVEKRGSGLGGKPSGPSGGAGGFFTSGKRPTYQGQTGEQGDTKSTRRYENIKALYQERQ